MRIYRRVKKSEKEIWIKGRRKREILGFWWLEKKNPEREVLILVWWNMQEKVGTWIIVWW